jgi:CRP/FNR family transcriptional regulator, cyclic AMP receptor protein
VSGAPLQALSRVPLFTDLDDHELAQLAGAFKERRFPAGDVVIQKGSGAAAFFVIDSGEASVVVDGTQRRVLGPGDHFGEMALIDAGARTATVTAADDLVCWGVTFWDFRPLVEANGTIGWKLLQSLMGIFRSEREG